MEVCPEHGIESIRHGVCRAVVERTESGRITYCHGQQPLEVMPVEENEAARKQWEDELLSDEAVEAGAETQFADDGYVDARRIIEAALASLNQKGGE
jgi:hypothetical protein